MKQLVGWLGSVLMLGLGSWSAIAADPETFKVSDYTFSRPSTWQWVEPSAMRKAQLKVTDAKTKGTADVIFFHFGQGNGGGTQANIERWYGQFQEARDKISAKSEPVKVGTHEVTYVYAEGTYKSGMPGGPQTAMTNFALRGAIIESEQGNVFVRMTGPKDLVKASDADFKKMIESGLKK